MCKTIKHILIAFSIFACTTTTFGAEKATPEEIMTALKLVEKNIDHFDIKTSLLTREILNRCNPTKFIKDTTVTGTIPLRSPQPATTDLAYLIKGCQQQQKTISMLEEAIKKREEALLAVLQRIERLEGTISANTFPAGLTANLRRTADTAEDTLNAIFDNEITELKIFTPKLSITANATVLQETLVGTDALAGLLDS